MKCFALVLLLATSALALQWTMTSSTSAPPPPPPPGSEPWRGILDYSRAADWSHVGVQGGIPTYTYDCGTVQPTGLKAWQPNYIYNLGDAISDQRGNREDVLIAGTSGSTEPGLTNVMPPSWPITQDAETPDGTVVWKATMGQTDTALVTNAVIDCSTRKGIVHLVAGHYYFTRGIIFNGGYKFPQSSTAPVMSAPISEVLLRGAGPMQTYLHFPRIGPCGAEICIYGSQGSFTAFAGTNPTNAITYPGSAAKWLGTTAVETYTKGDTVLIAGPWLLSSGAAGPEPAIGDIIFLDQNNDAVSICPAIPPATPVNCTVPGATESGGVATIVTSMPHGFHVGQCIGIGDVGPSYTYVNSGTRAVGFNMGYLPTRTPICQGPPWNSTSPATGLPGWFTVTAVGCIVSNVFVDQSNCGSNPLVAFRYNLNMTSAECPTGNLTCLADNGGGQATADTTGTILSSVNGATMNLSANATQSARLCSWPVAVYAPNPACRDGEISIRSQFEAKTVTDIIPAGQGTCPVTAYKCYTVDPGLYANNWRASQQPGMWWTGKKTTYIGVEGFTLLEEHDRGDGSRGAIRFQNTSNGWVRNVRGIDINRNLVWNVLSNRITMMDNYVGGTYGAKSTAYVFEDNGSADTLIMNNICQHTVSCLMTSTVMGRVGAYNFMIDGGYSATIDFMMPMMTMNHLAGFYNLFEGNDSAGIQTDNMHGTGGVSTAFRQRSRGNDLPPKMYNRNGLMSQSFNRGLSFVGMVMGTEGISTRYGDDNPANTSGAIDRTIFMLGRWKPGSAVFGNDKILYDTTLRWGNYDAVTGTTRWCGTGAEPECSCGNTPVTPFYCRIESEIPTTGAPFLSPNEIPASHTLPASFFLTGPPYFWTTNWGTPAWPPIGPDVDAIGSSLDTTCPITAITGTGPGSFTRCDGIGHHAYQIPAQICYNNLPVDTQLVQQGRTVQRTFTVTNATWTGGANPSAVLTTNNDLDLGNLGNTYSFTLEVTGIDPPGYNGTYQVRTATPTQLTYWLPTDPGTPYVGGGTVTTPNYKQFDAHMCYPNLPY